MITKSETNTLILSFADLAATEGRLGQGERC